MKRLLKSPSIGPSPADLGPRAAAASVLGVLLTPLGALIPTIQLGLGEDNDCRSLVSTIRRASNTPQK